MLLAEPDKPLALFTAESSWTSQQKYCREMHAACLVGLLHGLLAGWDVDGNVRVGYFTHAIVLQGDARSLLAFAIERPSARRALSWNGRRRSWPPMLSTAESCCLAGPGCCETWTG